MSRASSANGRHHADLQLAVVGLWHSGAVVLGRQHLPAPRRRRRAAAHGGIGRDPVYGVAGVPGNPPCRQRRRRLPQIPQALPKWRCRCARHWRWRSGWNGCGSAPAASSTTSRDRADAVRRRSQRDRPDGAGDADLPADRCRRRVLQPAAARLCHARGAGAAVVLRGGGPASGQLCQHHRSGRRWCWR